MGCEVHPTATCQGTGAARGLPSQGLIICHISAVLASSHSPSALNVPHSTKAWACFPCGSWDHKARKGRMDENRKIEFLRIALSLQKQQPVEGFVGAAAAAQRDECSQTETQLEF